MLTQYAAMTVEILGDANSTGSFVVCPRRCLLSLVLHNPELTRYLEYFNMLPIVLMGRTEPGTNSGVTGTGLAAVSILGQFRLSHVACVFRTRRCKSWVPSPVYVFEEIKDHTQGNRKKPVAIVDSRGGGIIL